MKARARLFVRQPHTLLTVPFGLGMGEAMAELLKSK